MSATYTTDTFPVEMTQEQLDMLIYAVQAVLGDPSVQEYSLTEQGLDVLLAAGKALHDQSPADKEEINGQAELTDTPAE